MEDSITDWIQAIAAVVAALLALIAFLGWLHDRHMQRLLEAAKSVSEFSRNLLPQHSAVRDLIKGLTPEVIESIKRNQATQLPADTKPLMQIILPNHTASDQNDSPVSISSKEARELRLIALSYLNHIEVALIPWRCNLADRQIIEEQLSYLREDKHLLPEIRTEAKVSETYPAIRAFEQNEVPLSRSVLVSLFSAFRHYLLYPYCCAKKDAP